MKAAIETFEITLKAGTEGRSLTLAKVEKVYSPLQTTVTLLADGPARFCIVSSHFMTHSYRFSNLLRQRVAEALGIERRQVASFSSHNHCSCSLLRDQYAFGQLARDVLKTMDDLTPEGQELVERAAEVAGRLKDRLVDVEIHWGLGHERRITHNRKGHRADGSTYMMREEDRVLLGADFNGDIDDDASVVALVGTDGCPIGFLTHFTGHPVTAYDPEHPVVFGEFPQVACDDLSAAFGGVPVGFLQGCAGDINAKGLLAQKPSDQSVADSTRYGHLLGETFIAAARNLTPSARRDLAFDWRLVDLPFAGVPPLAELQAQIADMERFIERCSADDEPGTRRCQGLNFPRNMSPHYRSKLVGPLLKWAKWAAAFHLENRLDEAPRGIDLDILSLRLGDVGVVGLPCEPFLEIGRQIKRHSSRPLTLPCGYVNDTCYAYVPDSGNLGDIEYMSAFYRYTTTLLPYAPPAGDALAQAGVQMLEK